MKFQYKHLCYFERLRSYACLFYNIKINLNPKMGAVPFDCNEEAKDWKIPRAFSSASLVSLKLS